MKIGWFFAEIWRYNNFQNGNRPPSWILEIFIFDHVTFISSKSAAVDLSNIEIKYVARYILSVALRMSDVSGGCVNIVIGTTDLVVK